MSVLVTVCFAVAAVLAFLAAFWHPPNPPQINLLALSLGFLALAFALMRLFVPGG
jgi:hypothetical protein